jgi:gliding motility-associated protein GldM
LYRANAGAEGTFVYKGVINFKNPNGSIVQYPFQNEYQVAKPNMTVSPTKMNVLYKGLANPISISVPGISSRDIQVTMQNGTIERTGDSFVAKPDKIGEKAIISVSATIDKVVKQIGSTEFRVKLVPNPVATIGNKSKGSITKNELMVEQGIFAEIPDFDFEMKFQVLSFIVSTTKGGFNVEKSTTGARFSQEQRDLFNGLTRGNRLIVDEIVVKGEDGITRTLPSITFKIN